MFAKQHPTNMPSKTYIHIYMYLLAYGTLSACNTIHTTYIQTYIHTYIHTYIQHTYIYIHAYIHAHIHTYAHTYTHTYIHMHIIQNDRHTHVHIPQRSFPVLVLLLGQ